MLASLSSLALLSAYCFTAILDHGELILGWVQSWVQLSAFQEPSVAQSGLLSGVTEETKSKRLFSTTDPMPLRQEDFSDCLF